jgi:hypothetical protein
LRACFEFMDARAGWGFNSTLSRHPPQMILLLTRS